MELSQGWIAIDGDELAQEQTSGESEGADLESPPSMEEVLRRLRFPVSVSDLNFSYRSGEPKSLFARQPSLGARKEI